MRILIFTGKGGVGKTSMAAAAACSLAATGKDVLIMSTDRAHSLGDSLDVELSNEPKNIFGGLRALELDTALESRKAWGKLHDYLMSLADPGMAESFEMEEVLTFPGIEELLTMLRILDFYEEEKYDALIVDCASTGRTLSMLRFPEILDRLMRKMLPFIRAATMIAGPAISKKTGIPKPEDKVFQEFETLTRRLIRLKDLLCDRSMTSIRLVTTPERTVIEEARQNDIWMHLYDFPVDGLIINRVYPDRAMTGYFEEWKNLQETNIRMAKECFSDLKIWQLEMMDSELQGIPALLEAAGRLYDGDDPLRIFAKKRLFRMEKEEEKTVIVVELPFVRAGDIGVRKVEDELWMTVADQTRRMQLPERLRAKEIISTDYDECGLRVIFS